MRTFTSSLSSLYLFLFILFVSLFILYIVPNAERETGTIKALQSYKEGAEFYDKYFMEKVESDGVYYATYPSTSFSSLLFPCLSPSPSLFILHALSLLVFFCFDH